VAATAGIVAGITSEITEGGGGTWRMTEVAEIGRVSRAHGRRRLIHSICTRIEKVEK
jgi:hypothetical protein